MATKKVKSLTPEITIPSNGEFSKYIAAITFDIGGTGGSMESVKVLKGDAIEYNGTHVKHNGNQYQSPSFRGAIMNGWVSKAGGDYKTVPSSIKVAPTGVKNDKEFSNSVLIHEERVVGDVDSVRGIKKAVKMETEASDAGDVVAKILDPASSRTVVDGKTDHSSRIEKIINNRSKVQMVEKTEANNVVASIPNEAIAETKVLDGSGNATTSKKASKPTTKTSTPKKDAKSVDDAKTAAELRKLERKKAAAVSESKAE